MTYQISQIVAEAILSDENVVIAIFIADPIDQLSNAKRSNFVPCGSGSKNLKNKIFIMFPPHIFHLRVPGLVLVIFYIIVIKVRRIEQISVNFLLSFGINYRGGVVVDS